MDDSDTLEFSARKKRASKSFKQRNTRGSPEGNSISHRPKVKLLAPPNSEIDLSAESEVSPRKRRKHSHGEYTGWKKPKPMYSDTDLSAMERSDTPDSLSQISAIAPVSDISMATTTFSTRMRINKGQAQAQADTTWENAVQRARGEPDGAEKSFHKKKSKVSIKGLETVPEDAVVGTSGGSPKKDQENVSHEENKQHVVDRKKSFKVQVRKAATRLKSLKSNKNLNESLRAGSKRKLDGTLADETMTKKPSMKELTKKERKKFRKMMKTNSEQIQRSKKIWEDLRRGDLPLEKRQAFCRELMAMVKGRMKEFCYAHDTARVIQCLIQYGSPQQREIVFEELKDELPIMVKSKYAKFLVKKFLMYGAKHQKGCLFKSLHGNVRKLIRHKEASEVVEYAYNEHANAAQRLSMLEDFYGPGFSLFKTHETRTLDQIMLGQPDKRDMILRNMKEALLPLIDKSILMHSMVHKVFLEFFTYADEKMRSDMIESLREGVVHMLHTRDGSRVSMNCIWHGTAKDRKTIIKSLKTHVVKICKEEYGHMTLLAIFDVVDDTKLVQKALLEEMLKSLDEVVQDQYGRKVLLYLMSPRDPMHFHPDIVKVLQEGDKNTVSKKDTKQRWDELLSVVSPALVQYLTDHAKAMLADNNILLLVLTILMHCKDDPTQMMEAVAKVVAEPFVAGNADNVHIIENPAGHIMLKRLIQNDKEKMKAKSGILFSEVLLKTIPEGTLKSWAACNRGCFTLLFLLELENPSITKTVVSQLVGIKKSLRKMTFKGAQFLLQKLDLLA